MLQALDPDFIATIVQFLTATISSGVIGFIGYSVYLKNSDYELNRWFTIACSSISLAYFFLGIGLVPYLIGITDPIYSSITFKFNLSFVVLGLTWFLACGYFLNYGRYLIQKIHPLLYIPSIFSLLGLLWFDSFKGIGLYGDLVIREGDYFATLVYGLIFLLLLLSFVLYLRAYLETRYQPVLYFTLGVTVCLSSSVFSLLAGLLDNRMFDNIALSLITVGIVIIYYGFRTKKEQQELEID